MTRSVVQATSELDRIIQLPARNWRPYAEELARILTAYLKRPGGTMALRPAQAVAIAEFLQYGGAFLQAPMGSGKCLKKGTEVLLYSGRKVTVEDVRVGDLLMGPDSTPRLVLSTTEGSGPLYEVRPVKGKPWYCNDAHILTLVETVSGEVRDIGVQSFCAFAKWRRELWKQFFPYSGVNFPEQKEPLPLDPYFLGVWYGDGSHFEDPARGLVGVAVSKPDKEIEELCRATAARYGLRVSVRIGHSGGGTCPTFSLVYEGYGNPLLTLMRGIYGDGKHLPFNYLTATREERLQFLAGLLDTDGYLGNNGYEFVQLRKERAEDTCFLAKSLGLQTCISPKVVNGVTYWRCNISGNTDDIPCRIPRKQASPRRQKKAHNRTGISVTPAGEGAWAGFTLTGDGRFLLGDFTVTHNTLSSFAGLALLTQVLPNPPKRPLLIVPAHLREKTYRDFDKLALHWRLVPADVVSYQSIGVLSGATLLEARQPEIIIADECHRLKNYKASVSRRVNRYVKGCREQGKRLHFMAMSGTIAKRSLKDFWHIMKYCRPDMLPLPSRYAELEHWANAIDERVKENDRVDLGALETFAVSDFDADRVAAARRGVQKRVFSTPGIISSPTSEVDCSLSLEVKPVQSNRELDEAFHALREQRQTPDGVTWAFATDVWRHARELGQGFFYTWTQQPPRDWLDARKLYYAAVRELIANSSRRSVQTPLDTPLQVAQEIRQVGERHPAWNSYQAWTEIKDSFEPETVPVWVSDQALQYAAKWKGPGVVWVEHVAFGEKLSRVTGYKYYGAGGYAQDKSYIEDASGKSTIIASIAANGSGRNLQGWHRALVMGYPSTGIVSEQLVSRHHRSGQEADEVEIEVYAGCLEHVNAVNQAKSDAQFHQDLLGAPAKLMTCDLVIPDVLPSGWAWREQRKT